VVTYDQIGDWFWGEEATEKYSLYSIAKIMEKIRKKIKDTGVYQELIFTIRGQGYVVYD
jgi:DNA-binding response OmpR family regulator